VLDIRQLRYFSVLAETLHYGKAARLLNISQPPLSRQIKAIEEELGVSLFTRNTRQVQLTEAGKNLYGRALRVFEDLESAVETTQAIERGDKGSLCISFTMSAAWGILPKLIKDFSDKYPDIDIQLSERLPRELTQSIISGNTDIGIAFPWHRPDEIIYERMFIEGLCAVLPENHRLSKADVVDVKDLADDIFISMPHSIAPALYNLVHDYCHQHGFSPEIGLEVHLQQTIVNFVSAGFGVSLVPDSMSKIVLPGAIFKPLKHPIGIEQGAFWSSINPNPCLSKFIEYSRFMVK